MTSNLSEIGICHGGTAEASPISYFTCLGGLRISGEGSKVAAFRAYQSCPGLSQCGALIAMLWRRSAVNHELKGWRI